MALDSRLYRQLLTAFMTLEPTPAEIYAKKPWLEENESVVTFEGVRLEWTERSDDGDFVDQVRENPNLGSAVAWGRRRIFRNDVVGGSITLRLIQRSQNPHTQRIYTHDKGVYEMNLAGFRRWEGRQYSGYITSEGATLGPMQRRIHLKDHE